MKKRSPELQRYQYYCCLAEIYIIHSIQLVFPVVMYGCESWTIKEGWAPKNWCFQVVLEKILEIPLDSKEIKPVSSKGNQPWIFTGRTDAEAEASILWPPDAKNWLLGKDPDAGENWRQQKKGWQRMKWLHGITDSMDRVWANSGRQWRTLKPGVLQSMGLQKVRHNLWREPHDYEKKKYGSFFFCPFPVVYQGRGTTPRQWF